jgi:hypothetical protein
MRGGREGRGVEPACDKCLVTVVSAHPTGCPADQRGTAVHSEQRRVIGGVDAHTDTHHAAALDDRGALLGSRSFPVSAAGYRELLAWLESFGALDRIGVESTGSFAAGLDAASRRRRRAGARSTSPTRTSAGGAERPTRWTPSWQPDTRSARRAEADDRDRRGDPPAARRSRQRGEVAFGGDAAARRSDRHRPERTPRAAR